MQQATVLGDQIEVVESFT